MSSSGDSPTYKLLAPRREAPAWDVVAQRGSGILIEARDPQVRADLLSALLLALFPTGTGH